MIEFVPPMAITSPCTGVCVIGDDELCEGCARTIDEIAGWASLAPARRAAVLADLPKRRA